MARRNKLLKFTEILTFPNVYENFNHKVNVLSGQNGEEVEMKGKWRSQHFKNDNPLILELACGRGEYSLALGERYPDKNFIGVDIKGARIWKGAKTALKDGLNNVAFLRTRIEMIGSFFESQEVDEIWITFPDPFLKDKRANRRLTAPGFLNKYHGILKDGGLINLKTDSDLLFEFTKEVVQEGRHPVSIISENIYEGELPHPDLDILTYYERQHLEDKRTIKFIQFTLNSESLHSSQNASTLEP
ncbi:MAG: tRNA (guanosine(46)-N7)-methyltransferase TrmB [Saprospiraceae bacterium]|nr:tRNA (guanosine(46)-N7)-methyltransferase TrmB [Saprospiraceae bacterium]